MAEIELKWLGPDDIGVFDAVADVFDNAIDPVRARDFLRAEGHMMIVALADGVIVGMASGLIMQHPDKVPQLFVQELGVDPNWRRQGIARRLMDRLLDRGRALGCDEAWLGTENDNVAARALYQGLDPKEEEPFVLYTYTLGREQ